MSTSNITDGVYIKLSTGVVQHGTVSVTSNVGIGTTAPRSTFDISGITSSPALVVDQKGAGNIVEFLDAGVQKVVIDGNGNVGIGTTTITNKLTVENNIGIINVAAIPRATIPALSNMLSSGGIKLKGIPDNDGVILGLLEGIQNGGNNNPTGYIQTFWDNTLYIGYATNFCINPYGGYVGIGTHSPTQKLHVHSAENETGIKISCESTNGKAFELIAGGTGGAFAGGRFGIYSRTDALEMLSMTSATATTAGGTTGKGVGFAHAGIWFDRGWGDYPSITVTNTNATGNTNQAQLRVHGTNASWTSYPSAGGSDFSCSMFIDGTYQTSDRRYKTNISSISNALEKVMLMDGKRYQLKTSTGEIVTRVSENNFKYGFIAQELQEVGLDELYVHYKEEDDGTDGYNRAYGLDYSGLIPLLVNAIKEQQAQIDELKKKLNM